MSGSVSDFKFSPPYISSNLLSIFHDNLVSGGESRITSLNTTPHSPAPPVHLEHASTDKIVKAKDTGEQAEHFMEQLSFD